MKSKQVKWVVRNEADPHRRISSLGGDDFEHSIIQAMMNIHHDKYRYWAVVEEHRFGSYSIRAPARPILEQRTI